MGPKTQASPPFRLRTSFSELGSVGEDAAIPSGLTFPLRSCLSSPQGLAARATEAVSRIGDSPICPRKGQAAEIKRFASEAVVTGAASQPAAAVVDRTE